MSAVREVFRHLQEFRSLYESQGTDELTVGDQSWSLWDAEYLFYETKRLPPRQQQAIVLCLYQNVREKDAAVMMGVSPTNPVMMYATSGIEKLIQMVNDGLLPRFRPPTQGD